ncbi:Addiction module protein [Gammaproteobacteria bacterium]
MIMNTIEIAGMSRIERLRTMETIWDSLIHESSDIESPEWHGDVLAARKKAMEEGQSTFLSIEDLRDLRARKSR